MFKIACDIYLRLNEMEMESQAHCIMGYSALHGQMKHIFKMSFRYSAHAQYCRNTISSMHFKKWFFTLGNKTKNIKGCFTLVKYFYLEFWMPKSCLKNQYISVYLYISVWHWQVEEWSIVSHHSVDLCFDLLSAAAVCLNGRLHSQI